MPQNSDAATTTLEGPAPYSPEIDAARTMQAEHVLANDAPVDVNMNAIIARSQALTVDIAGKAFQSNADRRDKMTDAGVGIFKVT